MGVPNPDIELIDKTGKRTDGRTADQIRPIRIEAGVLHRADGSCYLEWGNNRVLAGVYGPREFNPRRFQKADKAVVRCKYNMAAFSTSDRKRPGPDRRSQEIGKVIADAFENVVLTEQFPRAVIDINMEILQADAGTRIAALVAASVALADAGIPMKGLVSGCAAGKVNGKVIVDLNGPEDNFGDADCPLAINNTTGEVVLFQMDGNLSAEEFDEALDLAYEGAKQVFEAQMEALQRRFTASLDELERNAPAESRGKQASAAETDDDAGDETRGRLQGGDAGRSDDRGGRGERSDGRSDRRSGGRGEGRGRGGGGSGGSGGSGGGGGRGRGKARSGSRAVKEAE